ncbi:MULTISPECIES: RNA-binding cell elongation regulator Jag/EloR [Bacillaceae]|uniref:RNA-binding cell elongation regulator Jag/EloR n=1 Tax=Bacillaceae TaxID=186817 RepID=UPI00062182EC|nr:MULTISPECIES: RNA-binding cell elongation regulator Jag/EloR [Bacillaceae]KKE77540.1 protein jag [Bacilli bacterium VT-13-104]PZD86988.1 protein jag [Bacilli bacterium]MBU8790876.1 protein jag [Oceanobacillus caeni]MED4473332.1 RNA-binding cell elongation regulator Jag/EloR [Oceanobacillus caeni]PZD88433.1 protein jag [Bacilli bacterium]
MKEITASGQTVEEAVQSALEQLNTTKDQVEITIIDEGKKGILGLFGAKPAIVKVEMLPDPIEEAENYIKQVTANMNLDVHINTTVDGKHVTFELNGGNLAIIIGKRGQTLNALQYLVRLVINKNSKKYYTVTLDAEGYRERRRETLESLASRMADKVIRTKTKVALEPMPAYERKIIHSVLQDIPEVSTCSDGQEPHRHIVIKPS